MDEIREETPRNKSNNQKTERHHYPHHNFGHHQRQQLAKNYAAAVALRRNQSFDLHSRYPRIELPQVNSSRTYDVKRELAIKRSLQMLEQTRRNNNNPGTKESIS